MIPAAKFSIISPFTTLREGGTTILNKILQKLKNREVLFYIIFGLLTTVVNYAVFTWMYTWMGDGSAPAANAVAFGASVLFSFFTNKPFVFKSHNWAPGVVLRELMAFIGSRLFSFGIEELGIFICQDLLHMGTTSLWGIDGLIYVKVGLSLFTVVLNYISSKLLVFRKGGKDGQETE